MRWFALGRPDATALASILTRQADEALTYVEVGATDQRRGPVGYRHDRRTVTVGSGRATFDRLADAVYRFEVQRRAGLRVDATTPSAAVGTDVVVALPLRIGYAIACGRVVYTVDEGDRRGFAYGTLPRHPISGEEAFLAVIDPDGVVRFELRQFSRVRSPFGRPMSPAYRAAQALGARRYLDAARALV